MVEAEKHFCHVLRSTGCFIITILFYAWTMKSVHFGGKWLYYISVSWWTTDAICQNRVWRPDFVLGTKQVEEDNCGTNNIPTKILIEGTDVIPDIICRSTTCNPFIKVLEMQLISWMIDNTQELVVDTGIGHILQLKKHTNIATKHIIFGKSFRTHSQSQPNQAFIDEDAQP